MTATQKNEHYYEEMARTAGAEITQLSDGRWLVASSEHAEKIAARCFKRLETAAKLWLCDVEVLKPVSDSPAP
jgi:hypothetical protein